VKGQFGDEAKVKEVDRPKNTAWDSASAPG